jgi:4-hydroxy-tetrahydrodipicolinate synthase
MSKLILPIITPYKDGRYDEPSMHQLIERVEPHVDVIVPCLSSGEGGKLSGDKWSRVVQSVVSKTKHPVFAGILHKDQHVAEYISRAAKLSCHGVVLPLGGHTPAQIQKMIDQCARVGLEIIFYNAEDALVKNVNTIAQLGLNQNVVGLKDSSMDAGFLLSLTQAVASYDNFEIYQGMEMAITADESVDGYCIALANVEPEFCAQIKKSAFDEKQLAQFISDYNLESEQWYVYLKKALAEQGIIQSNETLV